MGRPEMITAAALVSGRKTPSRRYRVEQHVAPLSAYGIRVFEWPPLIDRYQPVPGFRSNRPPRWLRAGWRAVKIPASVPGVWKSRHADLTWLQRTLTPGLPTFEGWLKRPVILDVDDAVWLEAPFGRRAVQSAAKRAAAVFAGNRFLAERVGETARRVEIIPTAVDTERLRPARRPPEGSFSAGWIGSAANLPYLEAVEPALLRFTREQRGRIVVICDRKPAFRRLSPEVVRFIPWYPGAAGRELPRLHAGLMPLPNTQWVRGKCAFKMLQYMAAGLPVVASPYGMNAELFAMGPIGLPAATIAEWTDALVSLAEDRATAEAMGAAGRRVATARFDRKVVTAKIAGLMYQVTGYSRSSMRKRPLFETYQR
jgi:glycosyltransferase involved in cell wall biosynthesis